MYQIRINKKELEKLLSKKKVIEAIAQTSCPPNIETEKLIRSGEGLLSLALQNKESKLSYYTKEGIFIFSFVGDSREARSSFFQELAYFIDKDKPIFPIIEISNPIDIKRTDLDTFSCYLGSAYFSKEAKEVIYEYYIEALKDIQEPLDTVKIKDCWQEYRNILDFLDDYELDLSTDDLGFTEKVIEEIRDQIPELDFWVTNSENTLVVKCF